MKKLFKILFVCTMILTGINATPVNNNQGLITTVEAASVKLNAKSKTLYKGKSATLKVTGIKKKVTWSSSNKKIATVSSKGKVTAKKVGKCTITAKVNGKKYTCKITVKNQPIKLSATSKTLNVGKTATLKVTGTTKKVTWKSNKPSVATVSSKGKVTAKKAGTATITAKVAGKTLKCKVTVKKTTAVKKVTTVNAVEAKDAFNLINKERKKAGLTELKWNSNLTDYVKTRAKECLTLYGHIRPNGHSGALDLPGIYEYQGEILAGGSSASIAVNRWMNSSSHRYAILNEDYKYCSIAKILNKGTYSYSNDKYIWVTIFTGNPIILS